MNRQKKLVVLWSVMIAAGLAFGELNCSEKVSPVYPLNILEDEAKFTYYVNEDAVGTSHSLWRKDGSFKNDAAITMGGQTIKKPLQITVDAQGLWTSMTMGTPMGKIEITRKGDSVTIAAQGQERPIQLKPGTLVMEDMSPALMSQAVAAYDHKQGGEQKFPLFFVPVMVMDASLEYLETFRRVVSGKEQTFKKYLYKMAPVYNVYLTVGEENRVCLAEYPAQHGVFIRAGYDDLKRAEETEALISKAEYEVDIMRGVGVPMRDGIKLATDIYRPKKEGKYPAILVRTPYKKEMGESQAMFYARRGYVFAVQDVRGRFSSPGVWTPFTNEARDGYDTVEWLAAQEWCSGKVGMIGGSYLGWVQWWAASLHPPHLVTLVPNVSPPEPYFNFPYEHGALMLAPALWWADVVEKEATADFSGLSMVDAFAILDPKNLDKLKHLPVIDLDKIILGKESGYWRQWIAHPDYDRFWQRMGYMHALKDFNIPVYHQSGWFDGDGIGSKLNYLGMKAHGHSLQKLILGPWGHTDQAVRYPAQGLDFGEKAMVDLQKSYLRWMDFWLKGIKNGIDSEPLVSLFIMGANEWAHGFSYPLETTKMTRYYLVSRGDAAGFEGKGKLATELPETGCCPPDRYTYDPGDPTGPDPTGRNDLLIYRSAPLEESLTIAGPLSAVLYASSSAKDTDWVVRLAKLDREGRPMTLGKGILRARYRESFSAPKLMEPGKIYKFNLDMWHTGIRIAKGEKLVVVIQSALFPIFSRNLNTGGHNETGSEFFKAEQTIYHDKERPSHLLLPIIDPEKQQQIAAGPSGE